MIYHPKVPTIKFLLCFVFPILLNFAFGGMLAAQNGYAIVTRNNDTIEVFDYSDFELNWAVNEILNEATCTVTEFNMDDIKEVYVSDLVTHECYQVPVQERRLTIDFLDGSSVTGFIDIMSNSVNNLAQTVIINYSDIRKISFYNSSCGTVWQRVSHPQTQWAVDYSPQLNMFVSVGNVGSIYTSSDGANWTLRSSGVTQTLKAVYWNHLGSQKFVVAGYLGRILTSPNGINWTARASGVSANLKGITYGNGKYVVVGYAGTILTSTDAVTWTQRSSGTANRLYDVCYADDKFVAVGTGGIIVTSPDGINWTPRTSGTSYILHDITVRTNDPDVLRCEYDSLFVAVGDFGLILTSTDGITWTSRTSGTSKEMFAVTYAPEEATFVAMAYYGTGEVLTSHDGITWSKTTMPGRNYYGVAYGGYSAFRFVAVGKDYIARSICGYWWPY